MILDHLSIPFTLPTVYEGLAEGGGLLNANPQGLVLEFQIKDGLVGMLKGRIENVSIPITEIASMHLKKGWFRTRLTIRAKSLSTLEDVPGSEHGQVVLHLSRGDRDLADRLVWAVQQELSELELKKLKADLT